MAVLSVGGFRRHFGYRSQWSPDSRYLALQEWREIVEQPDTELGVVDMASGREIRVARAKGGFVEPVRFDGTTLVYETTVFSSERGSLARRNSVDLSSPAGKHRSRLTDVSS